MLEELSASVKDGMWSKPTPEQKRENPFVAFCDQVFSDKKVVGLAITLEEFEDYLPIAFSVHLFLARDFEDVQTGLRDFVRITPRKLDRFVPMEIEHMRYDLVGTIHSPVVFARPVTVGVGGFSQGVASLRKGMKNAALLAIIPSGNVLSS